MSAGGFGFWHVSLFAMRVCARHRCLWLRCQCCGMLRALMAMSVVEVVSVDCSVGILHACVVYLFVVVSVLTLFLV